jgi:hypothetical protein
MREKLQSTYDGREKRVRGRHISLSDSRNAFSRNKKLTPVVGEERRGRGHDISKAQTQKILPLIRGHRKMERRALQEIMSQHASLMNNKSSPAPAPPPLTVM